MLRRLMLTPILLTLLLALVACSSGGDDGADQPPAEVTSVLGIRSSAFGDNGTIPVKYTCDGENISPPLTIDPVPEGTETVALIVTDIDGPGGDFVHWTVYNMSPPGDIAEGDQRPLQGTLGQTGRGSRGYFGPCPPSGEHRYVVDVYALNTTLTLTPDQATKTALLDAMRDHTLQQSTLTGRYSRKAPTGAPTSE